MSTVRAIMDHKTTQALEPDRKNGKNASLNKSFGFLEIEGARGKNLSPRDGRPTDHHEPSKTLTDNGGPGSIGRAQWFQVFQQEEGWTIIAIRWKKP